MLKLLRTVPQWAVRDRPGPEEDRLGLLWGPGGLEVFRLGPQGMNSWRSPGPIPDVTCLRGAIEEALRHLGTPPNRAVMVVLHPEVVQIHVDVPAAAPASVVRTLIQRSFDRQKPVKGSVRWRDVPLASSGESVRRLVYAMPEELYQTIREGLRDHGIELGSMIPFAGLAVLEADADRTSDVAVLEAWHLPVGLAVGLRRGGDFWMVRPLVFDPGDVRRVARELRQTLGFAREHWSWVAPRIRLRGPGVWTSAVVDGLRSEGLDHDLLEGRDDEDWRARILRCAMGSVVDLVPAEREDIRLGLAGASTASRPSILVALPGVVLLMVLLTVGYRLRGTTLVLERERQVVEQTLVEAEIWTLQRDEAVALMLPWQQMPGGIPVGDLMARILGEMPDGLVLTELDLGRTESGWQLVLSGRSIGSNAVATIGVLDAVLGPGLDARSASVESKPPVGNAVNASWAELLAVESSSPGPGNPAGFRKKWILP
ncbi:MAG: hypothetical protein FJ379_10320 [Verrucomicrobia bacterium]|nr:hypothetical protein [Verrucomicrobiota bacterium]